MSAKTGDRGNSKKHTGTKKHHERRKHTKTHHRKSSAEHHKAHTVAKHATHAKARGFAIGDLLPVCAFEVLAASLRLAGQRVGDDDVLELWERNGAREASIGEALAAAALYGLGGAKPSKIFHLSRSSDLLICSQVEDATDLAAEFIPAAIPADFQRSGLNVGVRASRSNAALILGINVPGPHCVLATSRGWWSWGELHDPWPAAIEEAWAVTWS